MTWLRTYRASIRVEIIGTAPGWVDYGNRPMVYVRPLDPEALDRSPDRRILCSVGQLHGEGGDS